jgi:hypothetical protein
MKRLIGLITILLLSSNVFAQKHINRVSEIETTPTANNTIEDEIRDPKFPNNDFDWIRTVHFLKDGRLYLLAYEPLVVPKGRIIFSGKRSVYLYFKDTTDNYNPWVKASDVVIENYEIDCKNYQDLNLYRVGYTKECVGEVVFDNNNVKITVGLDKEIDNRFQTKPITFIFVPQGDGFYNVKK